MDSITIQAQEMYDQYPYGHFNGERTKFNKLLIELLKQIKPFDRIYDIGCGSGYWMDVYLREGISLDQITALDLAPTNIANLKRRGFNAVCGDVQNLPFEDHISDITICGGVVHHTPDPQRAMEELVRITKPGGIIFLAVYNRYHPWFYLAHKVTTPLRYLHWNWSQKVGDYSSLLTSFFIQPLAFLISGRFLKTQTIKTHFMDQVMTPCCHLFSKAMLQEYADRYGCILEKVQYGSIFSLMIHARLRVKK